MGAWKKVGAVLLGVGLIAAYRFARKNKEKGGLRSAFTDLKNDVLQIGESIQGRVERVIAKTKKDASEALDEAPLNSIRSGRKTDLTVSHPH